jgi:hypothetical protein
MVAYHINDCIDFAWHRDALAYPSLWSRPNLAFNYLSYITKGLSKPLILWLPNLQLPRPYPTCGCLDLTWPIAAKVASSTPILACVCGFLGPTWPLAGKAYASLAGLA